MMNFLQIELADLGLTPREIRFEANVQQREELATRFGLLDVPVFSAAILLTRTAAGAQMAANIEARVVQPCSVSLQPVDSRIEESLELAFLEEPVEPSIDSEFEDSDNEPIIDGILPVGEVLSQYFGLCVPSFPRAVGLESLEIDSAGVEIGSEDKQIRTKNPFAKLREIHRKL